MKLSFLAAALMAALALSACKRPEQALPANSTSYGTRTQEGTTLDQERGDSAGDKTSAAPAGESTASAAGTSPDDEYSGQVFSLDINSTGMAILCQREKAQYRKDTKSRYQAKKAILSDGFFLLQIVDIPG